MRLFLVLMLSAIAPPAGATPPADDGAQAPAWLRDSGGDPGGEGGWNRRRVAAEGQRELRRQGERDPSSVVGALPPWDRTMVTGELWVPVVLVRYKDSPAARPFLGSALSQRLFGPGAGSLRAYWDEVSHSRLSLRGVVYDWVELPEDRAFYVGEDSGSPARVNQLVREAVGALDARDGPNWREFDNDGPDGTPNGSDDDGRVDFLAVVHPDSGAECASRPPTLWSHRARYARRSGGAALETGSPSGAAGGGKVKINDYVILPGLGCGGSMTAIGIVAHEMGHALGLPDLYDTGGASEGLGFWGLMGAGNWNRPASPAHLMVWSKASLGWTHLEEITTSQAELRIPPIDVAASVAPPVGRAFQVFPGGHADLREHFVLVNRKARGFDRHLQCEGLLIWHVDEHAIRQLRPCNQVQADPDHMGLEVEAPDARGDLNRTRADGGNRGDAGDCWGLDGGPVRFDDTTTPGARLYGDTPSGVAVELLRVEGDDLVVRVDITPGPRPAKPPKADPPPPRDMPGVVVGRPAGVCGSCRRGAAPTGATGWIRR